MKTKSFLLTFGLLTCKFCQAIVPQAHEAMITIRVVDDLGQPVPKATIGMSTFKKLHPGEGFGRSENITVTDQTDDKGMVTLKIPCISGKVSYGDQAGVKGYYNTYSEKITFKEVVAGKWLPWNPTVELMLRRVVNPIPLYAKTFKVPYKKTMPVIGNPIGFDLMQGDWVKPHGKGQAADFVFTVHTKPLKTLIMNQLGAKRTLFDGNLTVTFSNEGDGIQTILAHPRKGSSFKLPREAPLGNYASKLFKRMHSTEPDMPVQFSQREGNKEMVTRAKRELESQNYFFRVRTVKDEKGKIVSALYGKIHGHFHGFVSKQLRFTYYLNPTLNDRNLEFDPTRNLFKNLSSLEEVQEP